jgi:hypothetical protein
VNTGERGLMNLKLSVKTTQQKSFNVISIHMIYKLLFITPLKI